jgi:hypothetical protein
MSLEWSDPDEQNRREKRKTKARKKKTADEAFIASDDDTPVAIRAYRNPPKRTSDKSS